MRQGFREFPKGEVRRIHLPRTPMNSVGCPSDMVAFCSDLILCLE